LCGGKFEKTNRKKEKSPPGISQKNKEHLNLFGGLVVIWFCVGADHVSAARADHSPLTCPALARPLAHLSHHADRTFFQQVKNKIVLPFNYFAVGRMYIFYPNMSPPFIYYE
jgi:hypothetical protein